MKKALVIGAAGFVGPYLCLRLKQDGFEVLATKLQHEHYSSMFNFVDLDILNSDDIKKVLSEYKPDVIFNLAAQSSVKYSWENPALTYNINVIGTINLLEAIKNIAPRARVLLIGSGEEYGDINQSHLPINENEPLNTNNFYAASKASQNVIGNIYHKAYGLDIILVRAFNHIGVGQLETFVVSDFIKQVTTIEKGLAKNELRVGNLNSERDFSDVRDIVKAYSLLATKGRSGETYNVGSGTSISIKTILDIILNKSKAKIDVVIDKAKFRPIDTPEVRADITKLIKDTGYEPSLTIEQSIEDIIEHYRNK